MQFESTSESSNYKFWIASSNFFETSLVFFPLYSKHTSVHFADAEIFDADGKSVNKLKCNFETNRISVFELSSFLEGLKYEAGIKHGLVELKTSNNLGVQCRITSRSGVSLLGNLTELSRNQKGFIPLRFGENANNIVALVNMSKEINNIRIKLFFGKRTPEINFDVPPESVRLVSLASEFSECIDNKTFAALGYIRIASRNDLPFALQTLECLEGVKEETVFSSIL